MTVSALITRNDITATASQTSFAYTFRVLAATDMDVYQNGVLLSSGYTVNNVGTTTGGTVVLDTGVPVGQIVSLVLAMPLDRTTNYQNSGKFLADDVNEDFDKIYIGAIQNENLNDRSLRLKDVEPPTTGVDMTLPLKADRKGKFLAFDATTGRPIATAGTSASDSASWVAYNFTGNGSTTAFTLGSDPATENNTQVYIDGVYQQKDGYSVAGAVLTFSVAPPNLSTIEVMVASILPIGSTVDQPTRADLVSYLPAGTGAVATTVQTKLRETVSVKDFGAVGDYNTATSVGTNNFTPFTNTLNSTLNEIHIPSGNYFNGGTGGSTEAYTGNGIVYSGVGSALNFKYQPIGNIGGARGKNHFSIGAIPRCAAGVFSLLDDANHTPMNVASISQPDAFAIRLTYSSPASKINSFVVGPDDALTPFGVVCGGDVGTTYANIITAAPFSCEIQKAGGTPSLLLNDLWAGGISGGNISVTASDASIVRITHTAAVSNDPPLVSLNVSNLALYPVVSFYNESTIDIMMTGDASGYLSYSGSAWSQALSDNLTAPTLTWTGSNTLKVDHGIAGSINRTALLTSHGGTYIPVIVNKGATFFEIAFYNYSGTKITTQDTNMTVWYKLDVRVPCTWANGVDAVVRRGHVKVPSALYSGVSGNNFWVSGDMEF